ncbi:MAG: NADH-quinone oxidoreductase subunit J [Phycisphaerae bacterium]|nr:NADH-quinone oxidoreductase subunit J [Phycisphaerae bacterium]
MPFPSLTPYALYIAGAIGAIGLYLLIRPGPVNVRRAGTLIGLAGVGLLVSEAIHIVDASVGGPAGGIPLIPCILGFIAVAGATRMVTHPKPVFAALYFILVVVSSAGLFLSMQAEFMAFALIIVYAGAILITYMFVLMLAQQSPSESPGDIEGATHYDRVPREPLAAIAVGFLLLATLGTTIFGSRVAPIGDAANAAVARATVERWRELESLPRRLDAEIALVRPGAVAAPDENGRVLAIARDGSASVRIQWDDNGTVRTDAIPLPASAAPTNIQTVGLALVKQFPASLELASVILLMAMFGAVVLARKQIELGEDERREAAGLRRLSLDDAEPIGRGDATASKAAPVGGRS